MFASVVTHAHSLKKVKNYVGNSNTCGIFKGVLTTLVHLRPFLTVGAWLSYESKHRISLDRKKFRSKVGHTDKNRGHLCTLSDNWISERI